MSKPKRKAGFGVGFGALLMWFATMDLSGQQIRIPKPMPPEIVFPDAVRDVLQIDPSTTN